jgi:hypothetical protein
MSQKSGCRHDYRAKFRIPMRGYEHGTLGSRR